MKTFKISLEGFKQLRNRGIYRTIPAVIIAMAVVVGGNYTRKENEVNILPYMIPLISLSLGVGIYIGLKKQKAMFDSYQLTIDDEVIIREQSNAPTVAIPAYAIKVIKRERNGNFTVRGEKNVIIIPKQIEHYAEVEAMLNAIRPIV
jgi:uncharacterized membrane protein